MICTLLVDGEQGALRRVAQHNVFSFSRFRHFELPPPPAFKTIKYIFNYKNNVKSQTFGKLQEPPPVLP